MSRTFNHELQLISVEKETNENGFLEEKRIYNDPILANKLSVRSSEYWAAKQNGVELSHVFEIHEIEYNGERELSFGGEDYTIERTYSKGDYIELTTLGRGDNHGSGDRGN